MKNHRLDGIQDHIDAVAIGDFIEDRLALIRGSNFLDNEARQVQMYFLKAFCLCAALEPLCGSEIDLGDGYSIRLRKKRHEIEHDGDLPGARVDGNGWLVIEGQYCKDGRIGDRFDKCGYPLWPFMVRNPPVQGSGPWGNFLPQALDLLRQGAEVWRYGN
jgi:hypothetical protein